LTCMFPGKVQSWHLKAFS